MILNKHKVNTLEFLMNKNKTFLAIIPARGGSKRLPRKNVLELCGINSEKYHWHDLRHTYATLLKKNINNLKVISKMLGHATTNMTEEVYIDTQKEVIDLCNIMNNYAENLTFQVRKNDEKIAQQDFDMAKMVDFLT